MKRDLGKMHRGGQRDLLTKERQLFSITNKSSDFLATRSRKSKKTQNKKSVRYDESSKKIYVLDTNVMLHDPKVFAALEDNYIVIPFSALDELDNFKKRGDELGKNARHIARFIEKVRADGNYKEGFVLETGGILFIDNEKNIRSLSLLKDHEDKPDHRMIAIALKWQEAYKDTPVILLTNDINMINKAAAFDVCAEEYWNDKVNIYAGFQEIKDDNGLMNTIRKSGKSSLPDYLRSEMLPNEFAIIKDNRGEELEAIRKKDLLVKANIESLELQATYGIKPRNKEQAFALKLLLDPTISLVTLVGKAGAGKTLLALAAAFSQFGRRYKRISVARPIVPMGNDIGYLPGDIKEKLNPWMQPIFDNLDILFSSYLKTVKQQDSNKSELPNKLFPEDTKKEQTRKEKKRERKSKIKDKATFQSSSPENGNGIKKPPWQKFIDEGALYVEPLVYIRGRSLPNQFLIIDEAQNLNLHEVKTIITRAGEGTKIVLTGDIEQIDCPYLDKHNNGLSIVIDRLKQFESTGHITLMASERSPLAELAANYL